MPTRLVTNSRVEPSATRNVLLRQHHSALLRAFFTTGLLIAGGGFVIQIGGVDTHRALEATASSAVSQTILSGIYLMATMLFLTSGRAGLILKAAWPVLILPTLAIISTAWSDDPFLTLRRSIAFLGTVLFGLSLASRYSLVAGLCLIIRTLSASMLLSVFVALVIPTEGVHQITDTALQPEMAGIWRGIFAHKNILGGYAGLTAALLIVYGRLAFSNWVVRYGALALSITCLVATHSGDGLLVAGILPTMLFSLTLLGRFTPHLRILGMILLFLLIGILTAFWNDIFGAMLWILGKEPDLTGRTIFWWYLQHAIDADFPLFGYGYFTGFALRLAPSIRGQSGIAFEAFVNAHNGYLEALVAFGYIGAVIMCCSLLWLAWRATRFVLFGDNSLAQFTSLPLSIVSLLIGYNMVESIWLSPNNVWIVLLSWCAAKLPSGFRHAPRPQ